MAKKISIGIVVIALLIFINDGMYIVYEDQLAVVDAFGKINRTVIDERDMGVVQANFDEDPAMAGIKIVPSKGLQFKIPFVENVTLFDSKYLTYTSNTAIINTKDSKRIEIKMYAQYRIIDPVKFKKVLVNTTQANTRMDEIVYSEVVKAANSLNQNEFFYEKTLEELLDQKHTELNEELVTDFGIYISDIGINRKSFPDENVASIETKMISQIEKESNGLIAEGDALYITKTAETDLEVQKTLSKAVEEAAQIRADADAEAIRIYTESLSQDLEFYQFIKRMDIYKGLTGTTVFVDDDGVFDMLDGYSLGE